MRISDWSSDVCSSDLTGPSLAGLWDRPAGRVDDFERYSAGLRSADFDWDAAVLDAWLADPRAMIPDTRMVFRGIPAEQDREIGRASWRARGCQYVWISVVAVSLKKNKKNKTKK